MATLTLNGSTSGNVVVTVPAISGTGNTVTIPASTGTLALASTSTSGGIFFGGATSGVLYQNATNLYWDNTNNSLGIGTNAPGTISLKIATNTAGYALQTVGTVNNYYGMSIYNASSGSSARSYLQFGNNTDQYAAFISLNSSTNTDFGGVNSLNIVQGAAYPLVFATGFSERMRVNGGAPILCLAGGNTSATGTGIAFPATQDASSDVNTLDDYEEGSWTPTNATVTVTNNGSRYIKIGKIVHIICQVAYPATASGANAQLEGLPFTSAGFGGNYAGCVTVTNFGSDNLYMCTNDGGTSILIRTNTNQNVALSSFSSKFVSFMMSYQASS